MFYAYKIYTRDLDIYITFTTEICLQKRLTQKQQKMYYECISILYLKNERKCFFGRPRRDIRGGLAPCPHFLGPCFPRLFLHYGIGIPTKQITENGFVKTVRCCAANTSSCSLIFCTFRPAYCNKTDVLKRLIPSVWNLSRRISRAG